MLCSCIIILIIVIEMNTNKYLIYFYCLFLLSCVLETKIKSKENSIIPVKIYPDQEINSIILPYKSGLDSIMDQVLCYSSQNMTKDKPQGLLGNFVTDLCLEMYDTVSNVCLMNNGGLRSPILIGDVTRRDIYKLMPFENELVVLDLNPNEFFQLIEYILNRGGEPFSGFDIYSKDSCMILETQHILYKNNHSIMLSLPVIASSCGDEELIYSDGIKIDELYKISVITSDYLANGGDKMSFFNQKNQLKIGVKLRDAIMNYCINIDTINSNLDSRINIYNE